MILVVTNRLRTSILEFEPPPRQSLLVLVAPISRVPKLCVSGHLISLMPSVVAE